MKIHHLHEKHTKLEEGEVVLDVRTPEEYAEGHVPGAINIPHEEVANHLDDLRKYKLIFVHCKMGGRAQKANQVLLDAGFNNLYCVDDSGMFHWEESNYPVEK